MEDEPRKRSRFDQGEPVRKSRFDRRSRSPSRGENNDHRSRSPLAADKSPGDGSTEKSKIDAAAAAAAAAARINASLNAKKGIQHVHVPPIQKPQSPSAGPGAVKSPSQQGAINDEIYTQDGDFIKDIEINDLRNRYVLTKGSTQKMIKEKTGADVTTRGNYYPDKSMATATAPPLYLHVTSTTKEGLEKAVEEIEELMKQQLPNLVDERRFRRRDQEQRPEPFERDALGRRKWPEERIPIDLEPIPGFNLRAQVVGPGGSYVKHIQNETRCRVQIKGRGSGFIEQDTGRESDEPMFLHVAGPDASEVERAKQQCIDLLEHVKQSYAEFKERGHQPRGGGPGERGGYGGQRDRNSGSGSQYGESAQYGGSNPYGGGSSYGGGSAYGQYGQGYNHAASTYGAAQSPVASADPSATGGSAEGTMTVEQMQQWAQYYAQNPSADPYAAYGGFATVYAAWLQPGSSYGAGYAGSPQHSAPPPPPPDDNNAVPPPPPPPPPPGSATNGYHSVPPPPGI